MRSTFILPLLLTGLVSLAAAQSTPAPAPSSDDPAAATVADQTSGLSRLVRNGQTLTLVDAAGVVIATVNPDGSLKLQDGAALSDATQAVLVAGGSTTTYTLARTPVGGMLFVTTTNAQGKTQTLPLVAVVNKAAAAARSGHGPAQPGAHDTAGSAHDPAEPEAEHGNSGHEAPEAGHGNSGEHGGGHGNGQGGGHH